MTSISGEEDNPPTLPVHLWLSWWGGLSLGPSKGAKEKVSSGIRLFGSSTQMENQGRSWGAKLTPRMLPVGSRDRTLGHRAPVGPHRPRLPRVPPAARPFPLRPFLPKSQATEGP